LKEVLLRLEVIEAIIETKFEQKTGRKPGVTDKVTKVVEEVGEILQEVKKGSPADILEIWDAAIAIISVGFCRGYSADEMQLALETTIKKLEDRWVRPVSSPFEQYSETGDSYDAEKGKIR
jgi:NTP pyrophosphatase (non-canonical NTP hydrolase)